MSFDTVDEARKRFNLRMSAENKQILILMVGMFAGVIIMLTVRSVWGFYGGIGIMFSPFGYVFIDQWRVTLKFLAWNVLDTFVDRGKVKHDTFYFKKERNAQLIWRTATREFYAQPLTIMEKDTSRFGTIDEICLIVESGWEDRFTINTDILVVEGYEIEHQNVYHAVLIETGEQLMIGAKPLPTYFVHWASKDGLYSYYQHYTPENVLVDPEGAVKRILALEQTTLTQRALIGELTQRLSVAEFNSARLAELVKGLLRAVKSIVDQTRDFIADLIVRVGNLERALREIAGVKHPWDKIILAIGIVAVTMVLLLQPEYLKGLGTWIAENFISFMVLIGVLIVGSYVVLQQLKKGK